MQYIPYLSNNSIDVTVAPLFDDNYLHKIYSGRFNNPFSIIVGYIKRIFLVITAQKYDLVWIEKEILPWFPSWLEKYLVLLGTPYIVDYDDNYFLKYKKDNLFISLLLGNKIQHVISSSKIVVVGNKYLSHHANKLGENNVALLPTVVNTNRYTVKRHKPESPLIIGWIGTPITAKYLDVIQGALKEICKPNKVHLRIIGAGELNIVEGATEVFDWSEESEVMHIQSFDIGIMPLTNTPWDKGKCGYKLIQYMACGIPVVGTPVGANVDIIEVGKTGYLANTKDEWISAITNLLSSETKRIAMGDSARLRAVNYYSLNVTAPKLLRLLKDAIE